MAQQEGAGVTDFCTCDIALWTILLICACVCLILATGPYWYYVAIGAGNVANTVIFISSAVLMIFFACLGIFGALKRNKSVLLYFALVMQVMVVFSIVQIVLVVIALSDCNNEGSILHTMCDVNEAVFFAHTTVIICVAFLASICAFFLRWRLIKHEKDPDNYY